MKRSFLIATVLCALAAFGVVAMAAQPDMAIAAAHALIPHLDASQWIYAIAPVAVAPAALRGLKAKKSEALVAMRGITDKAAAESRDLTADEQTDFDKHASTVRSLNARIDREELLASEEASGVSVETIEEVRDNRAADPKHGFKTFGEFAQAVQAGSVSPSSRDDRLVIGAAAPSTYGAEGSGQDGGFLVPPEFASEIFTLALTDDALLPLTDNTPLGKSNSMVFPKDETTPWGTDGVRAYWQSEAAAATATKPKLGTSMLRLHKLMALVPLTDELIADSTAGGAFLTPLMARSIRWKTNEAILNGTGAGQPAGAFNSNAAVVVAKEAAQAASTVKIENIAKMISRLPPGAFGEAIWLFTPDAFPSLMTMTLGNYPVYLPVSAGAQSSPYGTLMGRPMFPSQHVAAFSSQGDISLIAPSWYRTITKSGGVEMAQSLHLYFDADATAFRATFRVDGAPKIAAAIAQAKGSNTLSPFIQLGAR